MIPSSAPDPAPSGRAEVGGDHVDHVDPPGDAAAGSVRSVVSVALDAVARAGRLTTTGAGEAVEGPARALARRSTATAALEPRPVPDRASLARALSTKPGAPVLGGATATALATRLARRVGPLRLVARRTPLWVLAALVPAVHASVTWGAEELRLVASHLHHRARADGVEPDPERVRRVAVQILARQPVDPATEPRSSALVAAWVQRAVRSTLPFADGVHSRDPEGLASASAAVDVRTLAP